MNLEERQAKLARDLAQPQRREAKARLLDKSARTVEIAISSEFPVERWYGMEILSHQPGAVRLGRMNDGAAVLLGHEHDDCVGVIVAGSARIDPDKVLRASAQITRNPAGDELLMDLEDGIRAKVSVGYMIHGYEVTRGDGGTPDTIRATDWEPHEASFVAVPADPTVGAGRSKPEARGGLNAEPPREERDMTKQTQAPDGADDQAARDAAAAADAARAQAADAARATERTKTNERIRAIGREFESPELAEQFVTLERSVEEFQAALASRIIQAPKPLDLRNDARIEQHVRLRGGSHFLRAYQDRRQAEEAAVRSGQWCRAVIFGDAAAARWCKDAGVRVMNSEEFAKGAALVPTEFANVIQDLRESYGVIRSLARIWPMASDTTMIPRRTGGVTAYFTGQKVATTESDKSWDDIELVARELSALTRISMALAEDAQINTAEDIAGEIAYAFAEKEDGCGIDGDGTSTYGGIVGLRTRLAGTTLAGSVQATSGHNTIPEIDATDLNLTRAALPEYADKRGPRWLVSKFFKNRVMDPIQVAAGGATAEDVAGRRVAAYAGDEIVVSQKMPKAAATDYAATALALYGAFDLAMTMGDRNGIAIQVLRERYAEYRQIGIIGWERFALNVHDVGDTSTAGPVVGLVGVA